MAFSGVLVTCAFVGGISRYVEPAFSNPIGLTARLAWSEKMTTSGTTTNTASTPFVGRDGQPTFEIANSTAGDVLVSYGAAPNAATGTVILVRAGETRNVFAEVGDRLAWAAA